MFLFVVLYNLCFLEIFNGSEILRGIFLVLNFGPGIFLGLMTFAPIRSSLSLEIWRIRSTPPPPALFTPQNASNFFYNRRQNELGNFTLNWAF